MTTITTVTSPPERNSSRTTSLRGRTSQQLTSWTMKHNFTSTKGLSSTTEAVKATYGTTIDESSTKKQSLSSSDLSKTPERKQTQRRQLTSVKPTNSKVEEKTTGNTHGAQTSRDLEPYSNVVKGLPLKYKIIAGGSFAVLVFALLFLVCHLYKRRYVSQSMLSQFTIKL